LRQCFRRQSDDDARLSSIRTTRARHRASAIQHSVMAGHDGGEANASFASHPFELHARDILRQQHSVMAGLVTASRVHPTCGTVIMRKSGKPDFRCHPRLCCCKAAKTWMPATSAGMTVETQCVSTSRPGMSAVRQRANSARHPFDGGAHASFIRLRSARVPSTSRAERVLNSVTDQKSQVKAPLTAWVCACAASSP
jgi:hypothetical protein